MGRSVVLIALGLGVGACESLDVYAVTGPDDTTTPSPDAPVLTNEPSPDATSSSDASAPTDAPSPAPTPPAPATSEPPSAEPNTPATTPAPSGEPSTPAAPATAQCPSPAVSAGDQTVTLQVDGTARSYVLHVPEAYDASKPVPLIVDFHGIGESGRRELASSPYPAVTDPEGVILAFPEGMSGPLGSAWNLGPCCVAGVDDVAFARALVSDVQQRTCIDPDRVYAVGVLTGGGMVHHLACHAADVFAAVAPAAFDLLEETVDECRPSRPIGVISFRGTDDTRVPYTGGASTTVPGMPITFLGAEDTRNRWAEINGCDASPTAEDSNGCAIHPNCSNDVEVILCTERGGREAHGSAEIAWPVLRRHVR